MFNMVTTMKMYEMVSYVCKRCPKPCLLWSTEDDDTEPPNACPYDRSDGAGWIRLGVTEE